MAEQTVDQIENRLKGIEQEYQARVGGIDKKIADARASTYRLIQKDEDDLLEQRKMHEDVHKTVLSRLQVQLKEARTREAAEHTIQQAKLDEKSASEKASMLKEWIKTGGTPAEFETAYPLMRMQRFQDETLRSIASSKPAIVKQTIRL